MKECELTQKESRAKAEKLLSSAKVVFVGTNGSHGHSNVRAMAPQKNDGVETVWFVTNLESSKIIELVKDDKAVVYGYSPRTMAEFRIWGRITILEDAASRKHVWNDRLKEYFPGGQNAPELRVLRFDAVSGLYCNKEGKSGIFTI